MIKYKECNCPEDFWEEIIVKNDNHYNNKTVIYFHCCFCSNDFRVEDFETGEGILFSKKSKH